MSTVSNPPLKVGIAGLGRLGKRHAERFALRTRNAELVSACSPIAAELRWAGEALGVKVLYEDYAEFVKDPRIDAVVLVTPTSLHCEQAIAVLEAGKHVFCEKPLALDVADCEKVEAVAARHPELVTMIAFMRRFDPCYARAHAQIEAGAIGKPFLIRSQTADRNDPDGFFVRFSPTSGGIFLDCNAHDIDSARWMLGSPRATRVFASGTIAIHEGLREVGDVDNGVAIVEFEGGQRAVLYASRTLAHGHESQTEIIGTAGQLLVGPCGNRTRLGYGCGVSAGGRHLRTLRQRLRRRGAGLRCRVPRRAGAAACALRCHGSDAHRRRNHALTEERPGGTRAMMRPFASRNAERPHRLLKSIRTRTL